MSDLISFCKNLLKFRRLRNSLRVLIGEAKIYSCASFLCRFFGVNLYNAHLRAVGIENFGIPSVTGEQNFICLTLKQLLSHVESSELVLLDIGANSGEYSLLLRQAFPSAKIFASEPNSQLQNRLSEKLSAQNIKVLPFGFGDEAKILVAHGIENDSNLETVTLYPESLSLTHGQVNQTIKYEFELRRLDDFVEENQIQKIHFLKIDTEGHELAVLMGGSKLIAKNLIDVIQFEFNLNNVYSRVFLRDFYLLLKNYRFFRLTQTGLIALGEYHTRHEIFLFQNLIAVSNLYSSELITKYCNVK